MSDIKFSCPQCQQHIQAEEGYAGMEISCPVCNARMLVPGTRPAPAQAPVPVLASAGSAPTSIAAPPPLPIPKPAGVRAPAPPSPGGAPRPLPGPAGLKRPTPAAAGGGNIGLGIVGILLGAAIGSGLMYGFFMFAGFRFPLFGVGIGALTGFGGRLLYKGGDNSLGGIAATVSAIAVIGTLYLIYGEFPIFNIISVIVSVSVAYRIGSA
jgi:hypothetical protein